MSIESLLLLMSPLLSKTIKVIAIIVAALILNHILQRFIVRVVKKKINFKGSKKKRAETLIVIFGGTSKFIISIVSLLVILPEFGVNIAALLAGVGVLGLAVGMASREIVADFLSGIFIIIEDQYGIGDRIRIAGTEGEVREVTLRRTVIKDDSGMIHAIPNGQIKAVAKMMDGSQDQ